MASTSQVVPESVRIVPRTRSWSTRTMASESAQSPSQSLEPPCKKRSAVVAAPWQLDILVCLFQQTQNPSEEQRKWAVSKTGLDEKWISNWFQRQRNPKKRIHIIANLTGGAADAPSPALSAAARTGSPSRCDTPETGCPAAIAYSSDLSKNSIDLREGQVSPHEMSLEYPPLPDPFESNSHAGDRTSSAVSPLVFSSRINPINLTSQPYEYTPSGIRTGDIPTPHDAFWPSGGSSHFPGQGESQDSSRNLPDISGFLFDREPYERQLLGLGLGVLPCSPSNQFSSNMATITPQMLRFSLPQHDSPVVDSFNVALHAIPPPTLPISFPVRLSDLISLTRRLRKTYAQDVAQAVGESPDPARNSIVPEIVDKDATDGAPENQGGQNAAVKKESSKLINVEDDAGNSTDEEPELITPQDEVNLAFPVPEKELSAAALSAALTGDK
ncbi:hypothetical protein NEOLEDRAFT_1240313 [Neolentinus lepideus HHB14362 ss-1]|uniref:Homeobox domain-containing protein n=1 Tax=Neolentinus lepideus HHB14362 ss-1 TaxID=1314782 RepID=A0A165TYA4_9AGAM|nr:hypothetical protein NEOLEDRAFT_1240313 [Neolentinus lepideus HHB14362 ss-1]